MIGSYSNELRPDLGFVVPVIPGRDIPGIGSSKNRATAHLPIVPVPSRSRLVETRFALLNAHARRQHLDRNIDVDRHSSGRLIELVGWRFWRFRLGARQPDPSTESSASR